MQEGTAAPSVDKRQRVLDATLKRIGFRQDALIEVLHAAQNLYGYLTPDLLWYVASQLRLPPSKVRGVATFYNFFSLKPPGAHSIVVCEGTACYIRGAAHLTSAVCERFDVKAGETTADGQLSVSVARCIGSCGLAPAGVLDGQVLMRLTPEQLVADLEHVLESTPEPVGSAA
jgi:bidirectional [NiFe] hydrogenase diaphorase subunit